MIQIKKLSKIFQTEEVETKALSEVSITINQGDFVTIMGASGSGKSTLLNALIGEERNIVTEIAGTTRDSIHTHYNLYGKEFLILKN